MRTAGGPGRSPRGAPERRSGVLRRVLPFGLLAAAFLPAAGAAVPPGSGGCLRSALSEESEDVLAVYRKDFTASAWLSRKEAIVEGLVKRGGRAAREALAWCASEARDHVAAAEKVAEREYARFRPVAEAYEKQFEDYARQFEKQGKPRPTSHPRWPVYEEFLAVRAEVQSADARLAEHRSILDAAERGHGRVLDTLSAEESAKLRAEFESGPLAGKSAGAREALYAVLGHAKAEWVLRLLQDAARREEDAPALAQAIRSLAARDPVQVLPIFSARAADPRWLVRAAAIEAASRTPCLEAVDLVVARFAVEEGRLADDCLRVFRALTGADCAAAPPAVSQWWALHRETWKGPPPPPPEKPSSDPLAVVPQPPPSKAGATGLFGIDVRSRRICYVIDLSGSMNAKVSDAAKQTRAEVAKAELVRAIRALDDDAWFAVVLYANDVSVWRPEMTKANAASRKAAVEFVEKAPVVGGTATFDALADALGLGDVAKGRARTPDGSGDGKLDTIVLLSDGKPTNGRITEPEKIRAEIRRLNASRGIAIHTIAFGKDADTSFLEKLAKENAGTFVGF